MIFFMIEDKKIDILSNFLFEEEIFVALFRYKKEEQLLLFFKSIKLHFLLVFERQFFHQKYPVQQVAFCRSYHST